MNRYVSVAALLCVLALASCEKDTVQILPTAPLPSARVKFFNFGAKALGVNFYADSTKMTAISSSSGTESVNGVTFPGVGNGGLYSGIAAGTHVLTGRIAATVDKNLPIATLSTTIADGKFYSFYMSGFYNSGTKTSDAFVVEDPIPAAVDYTVAYVRLVHAISNANALTLFARLTGDTVTAHWAAVGTAVAYKGAGAFATLPPGVYDFGARLTGAPTNKMIVGSISLLGGRVYTIGAAGYDTVTTVVRDTLVSTLNR